MILAEGKTSFDVTLEPEDYGLLNVCPFTWFLGTWTQFPQIYLMSEYPSTAITWPTDSFYTRLR